MSCPPGPTHRARRMHEAPRSVDLVPRTVYRDLKQRHFERAASSAFAAGSLGHVSTEPQRQPAHEPPSPAEPTH